jgi:hypothetical protein
MIRHVAAAARRRPFVLVVPLAVALLGVSAFAGLELAAGGDAPPGDVGSGAATANTGICKNVKQAFAVHGYAATLSTSFSDIAGAKVTFTVSGTTNTCLIVSYTAVAESSSTAGEFRALLDGATVANPAELTLTYFDVWKSVAATYVLTGVPPGKHTLSMQFASFGGPIVEVSNGTLVVGFK